MCRCAICCAELVARARPATTRDRLHFRRRQLARSYGDSIDLTVYRCVQEGLTNAIRHAQAKRIEVELGEARWRRPGRTAQLTLTIRDDGRGIAPGTPPGFGMRGMQERVQGLGGRYAIESDERPRHLVRIAIPLQPIASKQSAVAGVTSVLVIDDHPIVLQGCRRMLEDAGVGTVLDARDRRLATGSTAGIARTWSLSISRCKAAASAAST